ncbi:HAD family hydrolase [Bacillus sp. B1-b2]|nr:HAD family hydrolase [Bacillus sp. B1-b2]
MIKAILFDLDGTLLNRDESVQLFIANQYDRFSHYLDHIPKEQYIHRFIHLDNHGYVWKDQVYKQLVSEFSIEKLQSEDFLQDYIENFHDYAVPYNHLISVLDNLKTQGLLLGIITNGFGQFQMSNIEALGISDYFHTILVSEWEGIKKPDPAIFHSAVNKLQVTPSECVYIGDHPINDIKAAQEVGMRTIWKKNSNYFHFKDSFSINELVEIPPMVKEFSR